MRKAIKCLSFVCLLCSVFSSFSLKEVISDENQYKQYTYGLLANTSKPIEWNSVEGRVRLTRTKYKKPFFALTHHFSGQDYPSTCGPASARIILSAIYEKIGRQFRKDNEHSFTESKNGINRDLFKMTERNVFDFYNSDIINYDIVARLKKRKGYGYEGGMELNELAHVIASHPNVIVDYIYTLKRDEGKTRAVLLNDFRETVKYICGNDDIYMIVLYNLTLSYGKRSGHYSPIVAYDEETDSVLIMDVATHLGTWVWVPLEDLFINMDPAISGTARGYIVIKQTMLSEEEKQKQLEAFREEAEKRIMQAEIEEIMKLQNENMGKNKTTEKYKTDEKTKIAENKKTTTITGIKTQEEQKKAVIDGKKEENNQVKQEQKPVDSKQVEKKKKVKKKKNYSDTKNDTQDSGAIGDLKILKPKKRLY